MPQGDPGNPPDKPGQHVLKGENVNEVLEQAKQVNERLLDKGRETEVTVVISAY